jgi:hypothetical protein
VQIGLQAAQALAGDQLHVDGNERPGPRLLQRRGGAGAQAVWPPLAGVEDAANLLVVVQLVAVGKVRIEGIGRGFQGGRVDVVRGGQRVHLGGQPGQCVVHQKVRAFALHLLHQPVVAQQGFF